MGDVFISESAREDSVPVVDVRDLHKSYGGYRAVRGVSFTVMRGELFALLGTNGAGKTTTLEILEGFHAPTAGSVRVFGLDPCRDGVAVRRRTGVMLQDGGFFNELTTRETVDSWRGFLHGPRRTAQVLHQVGLAGRADVRVGRLSGGERRRLDLALALLGGPELLFLDEPTAGMDPEARRATWLLVEELLEGGTTVVLTTHYLEEAQHLADRVAVMADGRIAATGTVSEVLAGHGSQVAFWLPDGLGPGDLPVLARAAGDGTPVVERAAGRRRARYTVDRTGPALAELHRWAARRRVELDGVEVRPVRLEDVFLELTRRPHGHPGHPGNRRTTDKAGTR
ncbi:ABC transporter ATP-binding protein [Streptomyces sp. HPF1205]|uniref:ABC transporter ATP-binding protein n=1 Tax=Streptomyces sp. HPF1205 TaxID=2873262 RepID=UPI001CEC70BD|nr:ABC transporter ATP-binding protein [Streptomyces sp. HPF1205]